MVHKRHDGSDSPIYKESGEIREIGARTSRSRNGNLKAARADTVSAGKI